MLLKHNETCSKYTYILDDSYHTTKGGSTSGPVVSTFDLQAPLGPVARGQSEGGVVDSVSGVGHGTQLLHVPTSAAPVGLHGPLQVLCAARPLAPCQGNGLQQVIHGWGGDGDKLAEDTGSRARLGMQWLLSQSSRIQRCATVSVGKPMSARHAQELKCSQTERLNKNSSVKEKERKKHCKAPLQFLHGGCE